MKFFHFWTSILRGRRFENSLVYPLFSYIWVSYERVRLYVIRSSSPRLRNDTVGIIMWRSRPYMQKNLSKTWGVGGHRDNGKSCLHANSWRNCLSIPIFSQRVSIFFITDTKHLPKAMNPEWSVPPRSNKRLFRTFLFLSIFSTLSQVPTYHSYLLGHADSSLKLQSSVNPVTAAPA